MKEEDRHHIFFDICSIKDYFWCHTHSNAIIVGGMFEIKATFRLVTGIDV